MSAPQERSPGTQTVSPTRRAAPTRAEGAAGRSWPSKRTQKPVLVGAWLPSLPSRLGARSKGCGHYVWGEPSMSGRIAAFGELSHYCINVVGIA